MLLITTLEAWREQPGTRFSVGNGTGAWVPDGATEEEALAIADIAFDTGQVLALTLDPAPSRVPPVGVVDRSQVAETRYARRGPDGRHVALLPRPAVAEALDLLPHPEGGWFRQTWATEARFRPAGYPGERVSATGIYFLLPPGEESMWHVVRSDEMWLWHRGGPLTLLLGGSPGETSEEVTLGPDLERGQRPQQLIPAGMWQAARPATDEEVLVSCVVSPGFDFADFRAQP